jgi:hypothetical protein
MTIVVRAAVRRGVTAQRARTSTEDVHFFTVSGLVPSRITSSLMCGGTEKPRFPFPSPSLRRGTPIGQASLVFFLQNLLLMEIAWFGAGCVRLKGREGTVAADAYRSIVGPTGRGLTADIATYSHPDPQPLPPRRKDASSGNGRSTHAAPAKVPRPTSLEPAFPLEVPGEYEIHDVLVTGVRTFRDEAGGAERGENVSFVFELDGLNVAHLGDIGHMLNEEMQSEMGTVDVVCVPIGGALSASRVAELVAQLDAKLIVPLTVTESEVTGKAELAKFLHEMGASEATPQQRLTVTISSLPEESTVILLEPRGKS